MSDFVYQIDTALLPPELRKVCYQFAPDTELETFVKDCREHPHSGLDFLALSVLSSVLPAYEAHGVLGMYPMHLLSSLQWEALVPLRLRGGRLLDIGAGQGFVTEHAKNLFEEIVVTETAPSMVRRLRARGFDAHAADITEDPSFFPARSFSVVSILNVLDRCERPQTLLRNAQTLLANDGVLIISDPIPFAQQVRSHRGKVEEKIEIGQGTWEECLGSFYKEVIEPAGLVPIYVSRLPYIYKSSRAQPYVVLDDFVMVCTKSTKNQSS